MRELRVLGEVHCARLFCSFLVPIVRFDIHADRTIAVEFSKPTQNPRLIALLLEALRKWHSFPAKQDGRALENYQDVQVHFNVGQACRAQLTNTLTPVWKQSAPAHRGST
jgi:hypothetical protein